MITMLLSKRFTFIIVVSFLAISIFLPPPAFGVNTTINSTIGDLDSSGDSNDENAVIQAAADCWDARITTNRPFTLNITGGDLSGGTLGQGATTALDAADVPTAGGITIDNSSRTWFIDLTPNDNSEFTPDANSQWRFINGPANSELYATVIHEIGHAQGWLCGAVCGFDNPSYELLYSPQPFVADATCTSPFPIASQPPLVGCAHLTSLPYDVSLRGDGLGGSGSSVVNELSHPGVGGDLMEGFGASGQRETPSEDDVNMFAFAYGDTVNLPPSVNLGADIISECNATGGSNVSLDGTASTDPEGNALTHSWSCPGIALSDAGTATPDGFFPLDSNTTCRDDVTDIAQCSPNAATVDVTVEDTTDPDIDCPDDITVECTATGGTLADDVQLDPFFDGVSATDICDANPVISDDAPVFFMLGDTTVEFTATDDSANDAMCSEVVTVEDTTDPDISCPAAITVECTAIGGIPADDALLAPFFNGVSATDVCDANPVISNDAPTFFLLGDTTVEFTAIDGSDNDAMCSEVVTVEDTTPPDIQCNAPATITPPDAPIAFTATATDICDADPAVVITAFDCFQLTKKGKHIDKTESCQVAIDGDSVTINNSGGVNDIIEWTVEATDASGNMSTMTCSVLVVIPS